MNSRSAFSAARLLLAGMALAAPIWATGAQVQAPSYTAASIVSAASYTADALAPNTIATIFGTNLAFNTQSLGLVGGEMPVTLEGVAVYISGVSAGLYYVSPTQINFLIPSIFRSGDVVIAVAREGVAGPHITITLNAAGPALFQDANSYALATHLDGSPITNTAAAQAGEWVVLYADGLGLTVPKASAYAPDFVIAPLADMTTFSVLLDGVTVNAAQVNYAGLAPGFAGLYQVNLKLPDTVGPNPRVQFAVGSAISIPAVRLFVQ
jgi:uncharacterized protein (TIGR03437 family)